MTIQPLAPGDPAAIGRYRLLGVLGAGGMGRVLLGLGPDGRFVAIKQVHPHLLDETEYRVRFRREVSASTRGSGAFTAPVIDFDLDTAAPWLASIFVVGIPLDSAVARFGPLPVPAVRMLTVGLASALADIHRTGLVHRDLKPANVMLAADGPRVIDFGIAKLTDNPNGLTQTGSILGSPAYMSPEQAQGEAITPASDVYALGSLLVMAATGTNPFAADSVAYTLFNIVHTEPDLSAVPPELRGLIAACLHKDPHARPTPAQLLDMVGPVSAWSEPWPPPIHLAITEQNRELAALVADPEATVRIPGAGRSAAGASPARRSGSALARRGGLAALLVLVLIAAGFAWVRLSGDAATSAIDRPTLAELRQTDACAWAKQALADTVSADAEWTTDERWRCAVRTGEQRLTIEPGALISPLKLTGATIETLPVLGDTTAESCDRGIDFAAAQPSWGLLVTVGNSGQCGLAEQVLTRLVVARAALPRRADAASLAGTDPCLLVTHDELNGLIGPLPEAPAAVNAHGCEWQGSSTVDVKVRRPEAKAIPKFRFVELDNGARAYADNPKSVGTTCTLYYPYRDVPGGKEVVEVVVSGQKNQYDAYCSTAEAVLRAAIPRLPA
ncbi:serine/threonine-protein kinase [Nocardia sp. NPDC052566]|uniref:serine/threonine-protein kinase n=1 Tax=Nocardia sp. NPDC052566 TaxID=3364330 RepID=UPI0037C524AE